MGRGRRNALGAVGLAALTGLSGCGMWNSDAGRPAAAEVYSSKSQDCLARAMYFESNRSSRDGMIAVGSVVMNRVASPAFPDTICAVVGQKGQFAPGVMTRPMTEDASRARVTEASAAVIAGERHPHVGKARFFHALYYDADYDNMHYTVSAGGNAFYEKRDPSRVTQAEPLPNTEGVTGGETFAAMNAPETPDLLARLFGG